MLILNEDGSLKISNIQSIIQNKNKYSFFTKVKISEIHDIYKRLFYDPSAQRGNKDNKNMIDKKHISQMKEKILNKEVLGGCLTWNIRNDENCNIKIDNDTIEISKDTLITIPDSAHRHKCFYDIIEEYGLIDISENEYLLNIYNVSLEDEKNLFSVINGKSKPPNRNRVMYLSSDLDCRFVRELIQNSNLNGKIETVNNNANSDGKIATFSTLRDSLFGSCGSYKISDIKSSKDYLSLINYLKGFYNSVLESREEFKLLDSQSKSMTKQNFILLDSIAWWGYSVLSKEIKNRKDINKEVKRCLNKKVNVCGGSPVEIVSKKNPRFHGTIIKYRFDVTTQKTVLGNSVLNSNTTRCLIKKIFQDQML